ncbi:MAG: carbohydrate ABC transporter permease [Cellulosilyticaceae bacterium]
MIYKDKKIIWIFLLPMILFLLVFLYAPFVLSVWNSLHKITDLAGYNTTWIGMTNYTEMLTDQFMRIALKNTGIMMFMTVVFEAGLGFLFAILVDSIKRGQKFYRTVFFFPVVISATAIGLMFVLFYDYNVGLLNTLILKFGGEKVLWLDEAKAIYMIAIPTVWQYVGFYFVIILTGIAGIPEDIYESAYLDGITGFKKTIYITIPLLKGVIKSCLVLVITGTLKVFDMAWVILPKGNPLGASYLLGTYQYNTVYEASRVGYGSAISVVIVILGLLISLVVNKLLKEEEV